MDAAWKEQFRVRIKTLRKELRMSQDEVAEYIKRSTTFVCLMETGEKLPRVETLIALADTFGTSLDELVGREK